MGAFCYPRADESNHLFFLGFFLVFGMGAFCCPRADESKNLARAPFSTYIIILVGDGRLLLWRSVSFRPRPSRSIVPGARGPNGAAPGAMKDERRKMNDER